MYTPYTQLIKVQKAYSKYIQIREIEKKAGLRENFLSTLKRKYIIYKQNKRAYIIGQRAAQGYNIYLTFGSDKTITKDAEDSYRRYAMAMKHYDQVLCDLDSFVIGYNDVILL